MKIIAIGDLHGNPNWEKVIKKEKDFDKIIFVGDYVDTRDVYTSVEQKHNLIKLLKYKEDNKDKVVILYGNHDHHYLSMSEHYSGFQSGMYYDFNDIYKRAINNGLIQVIYVYDNYIFSHAGISKTWLNQSNVNDIESINEFLTYRPNVFNFMMGKNFSRIGDDITQSPIWIRIPSLKEDCIDGYIQVVGHTACKKAITLDNIICIDCFNESGEYLMLNDGVISFNNI